MTYREAERRAKQMSPTERRIYMVAVGFNPGLIKKMSQSMHFTYYVTLAFFFSIADRNHWVKGRNYNWAKEQSRS